MAKRIFQAQSFTPTAQNDTTALTSSTYMALTGGSATQILNIIEVYEGGQATASAVNVMTLSRSSTVGVIPTALAAPNSDGPMHGATAALAAVPVSYVAAGTGPQRAATVTLARLNLSFNAFGGIVRWVAAPGEEWTVVGNAVNVSETLLSAGPTAGNVGLMGAHMVYEPF